MGSCTAKEQKADCQMMQDPIYYEWNELLCCPSQKQAVQKEVSNNSELHSAEKRIHSKLGAGHMNTLPMIDIISIHEYKLGPGNGSDCSTTLTGSSVKVI
uniref:1-phosphatidylinositol-4,5-bisphosphate phosphodiesterase gamma 1 n=1 Tax=Meleagris gallopavo TaxID=9103 RepID=G4VXN7_MELGA|nr:1-phosphatidylinositol-4,5-bisphosphate phosphodiesterase gamma 1 [Meleagris gallopavo]